MAAVEPRAETGRFVGQHQLDSADAPRPVWPDASSDAAATPTMSLGAPAVPTRPTPATVTAVAGPTTGPMGVVSPKRPARSTMLGTPELPTPPAVPSADPPFTEELDEGPVPYPRPTTVELLKEAAEEQSLRIPAMEALAPGTLVLGAPPATNPRLPAVSRDTARDHDTPVPTSRRRARPARSSRPRCPRPR